MTQTNTRTVYEDETVIHQDDLHALLRLVHEQEPAHLLKLGITTATIVRLYTALGETLLGQDFE